MVGEGHNDFQMYDKEGAADYPDYRSCQPIYYSSGMSFSLLAEYVNATANGLNGLYVEKDEGCKIETAVR